MNSIQLEVFCYWAELLNIPVTEELLALAHTLFSFWDVHESESGIIHTTIRRVSSKDPTSDIFRILALSRTFIFRIEDGTIVVLLAGLPQFSDITELTPEFWQTIAEIPLTDSRVKALREKHDGSFITVCAANRTWSTKRGFMNPKYAHAADLCFRYIETHGMDPAVFHLFEFVSPGGAVTYLTDAIAHIGTCNFPNVVLPSETNVLGEFTTPQTVSELVDAVKDMTGTEGYVLELEIDGVMVLLKLKTLWWRKKHCQANMDPIWAMIQEFMTSGRWSLDNVLWAAKDPELMASLIGLVDGFLYGQATQVKSWIHKFNAASGKEKGIVGSQAKGCVTYFANTLSSLKDLPLKDSVEVSAKEYSRFGELFKKRIEFLVQGCNCSTCRAGNKHRCYPTTVKTLVGQIWDAVVPDTEARIMYGTTYTH